MTAQSPQPHVGVYKFTLVYGSELPELATKKVVSEATAAAVLNTLHGNTENGPRSWCAPDLLEHGAYTFIRRGQNDPDELTSRFHLVSHDRSLNIPTSNMTSHLRRQL
jgi:hypothetical protein